MVSRAIASTCAPGRGIRFSVRTPKTTATLSETAEGRALICAGSKFRTFSFAPEARREVELRERWSYSKKVR